MNFDIIKVNFDIKPDKEFIDITELVQAKINELNVEWGFVIVYTKHTTACIRLLENETLLMHDMHDFLERIAPSTVKYRHDDIEHRDVPPDERLNGFSHLRAMFLNHQELLFVEAGKLDLGKWQKIFYIECDLGKENRTWNLIVLRGKNDDA